MMNEKVLRYLGRVLMCLGTAVFVVGLLKEDVAGVGVGLLNILVGAWNMERDDE